LRSWADLALAYFLGKRAERAKQAQKALARAAKGKRIDEKVGDLTPAERSRWLRGKRSSK